MTSGTFPRITREQVERLRASLGKEIPIRDPFNRYATPDTIRHFAHAIGDTNPLFTDEEYARRSRWGGVVAPPTFLFTCLGRRLPQGLPGIHAMWAGASFEMEGVVREGTRIDGTVALTKVEEKASRFSERAVHQEFTYTLYDGEGRLLGRVREWLIRTERDTARERGTYARLHPAVYTPEEIERIFADYEREVLRGATPRYWEEVEVGEEVPWVVKGPLRVTDCIAWKIGWGFPPFAFAHRIAVEYYRRHPMAFIPNAQGVPDVPERVHWDPEFAQRVGVPHAYDYGPQRVAWLCQVVTNWMGDDGVVRSFWGEVRRFNLIGDTHWLKGRVVAKGRGPEGAWADLELWGEDQRGETTIRGGARVLLPTRSS